jgi:hypothetical protein
MKKTFKKKTIWKEKETKKNFKRAKRISAYLEYRNVYDDLIEYTKVISF